MKYTPAGVDKRDDVRRSANFIISGLTCGHGVFHWIMQSFLVMLPEVQAAFSLTGVGVGGIATTREMVSGIVTLPGGVIVDMLRRYWGLVLAVCMGGFGLGWLVIGVSPVYPLLLVGTGLMAIAASIWHLPATAALSHHFAHRRGTALSFHGIGGNIGDVVGPVTTGALLAVLSWREILSIYAAVPLFLAFAVYWAFKDIGRSGDQYGQAPDLGDHIAMTRTVLRNRALWGITLVAGLRGMAFVALMTFLPLYLDDELGMSVVSRGLHIGLLVAIGVVATPAMGYLSDRFGRKLVLVPGLVWLSLLTLLLAPFGQGVTLTFLLALLGLFLYSDQPILTASALDIVGEGVVTTTLGALSFSRFVLSAASPLIAGGLYQTFGMDATFLYVAVTLALAAATLAVLPIPARSHVATVDSAGRQDS